MNADRLRVAVIGAGWWGAQHARVFAGRDDTELCAIVARRPETADARAGQYGAVGYTDIEVMLEAEHPDFVTLSLPNTEHYEPTLAVLRAGYPVLAEKPLVFDLKEADTLLAEAEAHDLFFAINFNHRYARAVQNAKRAIDDGRTGDTVFATWRFGGEGTSAHHPYADLIETQCHGFDMLEHLCGPITSVWAEMSDVGGDEGPGTMVLGLRFANGAVGSLVGSYRSSYVYTGTHRLEVNGTAGRVVVDDTVRRFEFQAAGNETAEVWQAGYFNDANRSFAQTMDRYVHSMLKAYLAGEPPPVPAIAGRRALVLAHAAIEAHETGRRVEVPLPSEP